MSIFHESEDVAMEIGQSGNLIPRLLGSSSRLARKAPGLLL